MKSHEVAKLSGNDYLITHWDVDKALETLVWLTKTFGEGFVAIFTKGDSVEDALNITEDMSDEENTEAILSFMSRTIDRLNAKEYVKYSKIIVDGVKCNGKGIDFRTHFVGKLSTLHLLMFEVLRFQYGDFLGESSEADS